MNAYRSTGLGVKYTDQADLLRTMIDCSFMAAPYVASTERLQALRDEAARAAPASPSLVAWLSRAVRGSLVRLGTRLQAALPRMTAFGVAPDAGR